MERRASITIPRRFALLDRELTNDEIMLCRDFSKGFGYPRTSTDQAYGGIAWYDSVAYCRWLNSRVKWHEGDQPYPAISGLDPRKYPPDPAVQRARLPRLWPVHLDRLGARLPTEAEWETACRGGTMSSWSFGEDLRWLDEYAWTANGCSQAMVTRLKRPNLRGLFDMLGNRREWCHDWCGMRANPDEHGLRLDTGGKENGASRSVRGGSVRDASAEMRSAARESAAPGQRMIGTGLRIAMTLPPPTPMDEGMGQDDAAGDAAKSESLSDCDSLAALP